MRRTGAKRWLGLVVLALAGLVGYGTSPAGRQVYYSASRFAHYFRVLESSEIQPGILERAAISVVLASAESNACKLEGRNTI